jgi:hypothetical protein
MLGLIETLILELPGWLNWFLLLEQFSNYNRLASVFVLLVWFLEGFLYIKYLLTKKKNTKTTHLLPSH